MVFGFMLFLFFINDFLNLLKFVEIYLYVDDIIIYCVVGMMDLLINMLNNVLVEF